MQSIITLSKICLKTMAKNKENDHMWSQCSIKILPYELFSWAVWFCWVNISGDVALPWLSCAAVCCTGCIWVCWVFLPLCPCASCWRCAAMTTPIIPQVSEISHVITTNIVTTHNIWLMQLSSLVPDSTHSWSNILGQDTCELMPS